MSVVLAFNLISRSVDVAGTAAPRWPWWDLPGRAVATGLLVVLLTTISARLGPGTTGVLAPFPVATSVVAAFVAAHAGPDAVEATLRGVLRGLYGFAAFCFLVAVLIEPAGIAIAFTAGGVGAVLTQLLARRLDVRGGPAPTHPGMQETAG